MHAILNGRVRALWIGDAKIGLCGPASGLWHCCCRMRQVGDRRGERALAPPERRAQLGAQEKQPQERNKAQEYCRPRELIGKKPSREYDRTPCSLAEL
jgi:hypothetical protein